MAISGATVWRWLLNVRDLLTEGYWESVEFIKLHPHATFLLIGGYLFYRGVCFIAGLF